MGQRRGFYMLKDLKLLKFVSNNKMNMKKIKDNVKEAKLLKGYRSLCFLDGSCWVVKDDECRGCLMSNREGDIPVHLRPIFKDKDVCVRQDSEFSVPAFYIVSTTEHLAIIADIPSDILCKIMVITKVIRKIMKEKLGIEHVNIYHEERLKNSHYHHWILPIWSDKVVSSGYIPKIYQSMVKKYATYEADIHRYLKSFKFQDESTTILKCNEIVDRGLREDKEIRKFSKNVC
jgi:diadenosine tetraphosphate (Ap4A) HIT family hydrolase